MVQEDGSIMESYDSMALVLGFCAAVIYIAVLTSLPRWMGDFLRITLAGLITGACVAAMLMAVFMFRLLYRV